MQKLFERGTVDHVVSHQRQKIRRQCQEGRKAKARRKKLIYLKVQENKMVKISVFWGNDHLIEFQLIEIVFYHLIEIMLIT